MPDIPAPAATAARALLASAVRHSLTMAGAALVTRGLVDQGAVDGAIPTLVEVMVGTLLAAGATGWGQLRAWLAHGRFAAAWAVLNGEPTDAALRSQRFATGMRGELIPLTPAAAGQADSAGPAA